MRADLMSPERIAMQYDGNKQKIAAAVQAGILNPTVAVMAGMFIDRMRAGAAQEQMGKTTVEQDVLGAPQMPAGLGATPQAQQLAQGQERAMQAVPPVQSGVAALPVDERMIPGGEGYAGGGIVAFAGDTNGSLVDMEEAIRQNVQGRYTTPSARSFLSVGEGTEVPTGTPDPKVLRAYYISRGLPLPVELMTDAEKAKAIPGFGQGPIAAEFDKLAKPKPAGPASSIGELFTNLKESIAGAGKDTRIDPETGKEVTFGEYMRSLDERKAAAARKNLPAVMAAAAKERGETPEETPPAAKTRPAPTPAAPKEGGRPAPAAPAAAPTAAPKDLESYLAEQKLLAPTGEAYAGFEKQITEDRAKRAEDKTQAGWMRLAEAGFGAMAGTSRYAMVNFGKAFADSMKGYADDLKEQKKLDREDRKFLAEIEQARRQEGLGRLDKASGMYEKALDRLSDEKRAQIQADATIRGHEISAAASVRGHELSAAAQRQPAASIQEYQLWASQQPPGADRSFAKFKRDIGEAAAGAKDPMADLIRSKLQGAGKGGVTLSADDAALVNRWLSPR